MEVREALQKRRSIRKYTEDAVSKEQLEELLHAAMSGPSAWGSSVLPGQHPDLQPQRSCGNLRHFQIRC